MFEKLANGCVLIAKQPLPLVGLGIVKALGVAAIIDVISDTARDLNEYQRRTKEQQYIEELNQALDEIEQRAKSIPKNAEPEVQEENK